jgi:hypothetical protein
LSTIFLQFVDTTANFTANMGFAADMTSKANNNDDKDNPTTLADRNLIYYFYVAIITESVMFLITISALMYERCYRGDHFAFQKSSKYVIGFTLIFGNAVCEAFIDYLGIKLF